MKHITFFMYSHMLHVHEFGYEYMRMEDACMVGDNLRLLLLDYFTINK